MAQMKVQYLIKDGTIVDRTGGPAYRSDLRVKHGRIAQIAPELEPEGRERVPDDGEGIARSRLRSSQVTGVLVHDPLLILDRKVGDILKEVPGLREALAMRPVRAEQDSFRW
jgi:hypothetical protein